MQVYYAPDICGQIYTLSEKESLHLIRVLRKKKGDPVNLIDGKGNLYHGNIDNDNIKHCTIKIKDTIINFENRDYHLHIAISPLKNNDRFEWFVEKSVEIGLDEITPLLCRHTVKKKIKTERISNIIISAMKQSLKAKDTIVNPPCTFSKFLDMKHKGIAMIAHCNSSSVRKSISEVYEKGSPAIIMIGPEGDFSEEETLMAVKKGIIPVHLGESRLRTETAGIAACHSVYFINQKETR